MSCYTGCSLDFAFGVNHQPLLWWLTDTSSYLVLPLLLSLGAPLTLTGSHCVALLSWNSPCTPNWSWTQRFGLSLPPECEPLSSVAQATIKLLKSKNPVLVSWISGTPALPMAGSLADFALLPCICNCFIQVVNFSKKIFKKTKLSFLQAPNNSWLVSSKPVWAIYWDYLKNSFKNAGHRPQR